MRELDRLTDPAKGGSRVTVRQYNRVLTGCGFTLDEPKDEEISTPNS
jgi:hypothetical protein